MNLKKFLIAGLLTLSSASAFAGYTVRRVDLKPLELVQGREYALEVFSTGPVVFDNVFVQATGALASYDIFVGAGIQVGPNEYRVDATGRLIFNIRFHRAPGNVNLTVTNSNDITNFVTVTPSIQRYPVTFQITPSLPTIDANVPFNVQVTAVDSVGTYVSAFEDSVQIKDSVLGDITSIPGSAFVAGVATATVRVKAGDINNKVKLQIDLVGVVYRIPAAVPPATFLSPDLNLIPGPYSQLVMLFPGEVLDPGIGKTGTTVTQVANVPVSNVTVWPVDSFFNPIYSSVSMNIQFTSSIGPDVMPADRLMTTPPLQILGGAVDPFRFLNSGTRFITASRVGGTIAEQSVSQVPVAPGATNTYDFDAMQPVGPYKTDDVITVKITARDTLGGVLTTLFGQLPLAKLSARVIGTPTQENVAWADTNPATLFPDNVVNFVAGVATVNLSVTRRGNVVDLHFQDQFGVGVFSNQFQVNVGALDKVHLTIVGKPGILVGETFSPGTYPGNSGTPPVITAGESLVVEARLTDRHWNIVSGPAIIGLPIQMDSLVPNTYITSTHPDDPSVTFDISGELKYQAPPFDKSFRVAVRTAGLNRSFRANSSFVPTDFLSSTITVNAGSYAKVALAAPGETLRPGSFFPNGKAGAPSSQGAGISFPMIAYLTDTLWNPIESGPYTDARLFISPSNPSSFISGVTLGSPATMPASARTFVTTLAENSSVRLEDAANAALNQTVAVPIGPGIVDHFRFSLTTASDKEAGVPFGVTIQVEDRFNQIVTGFNNAITLSANTGAETMTPTTVTLVNGVVTSTMSVFTATTTARVTMTWGAVSTTGNPFRVIPNSAGYRKLLILGPDEVHRPGTPLGKSGSNAARQVGVALTVRAIACDNYFNKLDFVNGEQAQFLTNNFGQFSPAIGNVTGGEFNSTFIMKAASTHTLTVMDLTAGGVSPSTSSIVGRAGSYTKLQILMPGEISEPGNEVTGGKLASASALNQMVSVSTRVQVNAVDQYFNLARDGSGNLISGGDIIFLSSPTNALYLPANNPLGGATPRTLTSGIHTRDILFGSQGFYVLKAFDQNDFTKTPGEVTVNVQPGPVYNIATPASGVAGVNFPAFTIRLEMGGVPVTGYNQTVFLSATLSDGTPAAGQFTPDGSEKSYTMSNGAVTISDLNYQHAEVIKIKVRDIFGRIAFSGDIDVQPSGLKYTIVTASAAVAGPPAAFAMRIELRDKNTNTLVKGSAYNHSVSLTAISLLSATTDGTLSVSTASISNGIATLSIAYTKAESISIRVTNLNLVAWSITPLNSTAINILPGAYKKLILLAPGETHTPGVLTSDDGKSGAPDEQDKKLGVVLQVRGVDQYWNTVDTFDGGIIHLESSDPDAFLEVPVPQDNPLANGASASLIKFNKAGDISVKVKDLSNTSIQEQQVVISVVGTSFEIMVPVTQNTGAPFSMIITLRNSLGAIVPSFGAVTIDAYHGDAVASGTLDVRTANLINGQVTITDQRYTIAEDIRLRVSDGIENTNNSNVIHFVPRAIFYVYENIPSEGEVNTSFNFRIQAMDADTGSKVKNFNRSNLPLVPFEAASGTLATGVFVPSVVNIVNGAADISASYNKAETIYFRLTDNTTVFDPAPVPTQNFYFSGSSIKIKAAPVSTVDIADFDLLASEMVTMTLVAKDSFGNPIPDQTLSLTADIPGQLSMNTQNDTFIGKTDGSGNLPITFKSQPFGNGLITVVIKDVDRPDRGFAKIFHVNILGLSRGPARAALLGSDRIPVNSRRRLDISNLGTNGGTLRTWYRIDGGPTWLLYDPTVGAEGFTSTKKYTLEWYSEVCYDAGCTSPISELSISGAPNVAEITTYQISEFVSGYPSPFNPKGPASSNFLTIQYPLAADSSVEIDIYNLFGEKVWHKDINAGEEGGLAKPDNRVFWLGVNDEGKTVANGGYVVTVKVAGGQTMKTKVLVVK